METVQYIQMGMTVVTGGTIPILIWILTRQDNDRAVRFAELNSRISHLDECLDEVKQHVAGGMVSRSEVDASLLRMREAISGDTKGLHDRIMRLEDHSFLPARG